MPIVLDLQPDVHLPTMEPKKGPDRTSLARTTSNETRSQQYTKENETHSQQINIAKAANLKESHNAVRKVVRAAARLADLCTTEDLETDARVIREATTATLKRWDQDSKRLIVEPDHKTRLAATTLRRAYVEGTPVKREIVLTSTFVSAEEIIEQLRQSPEARRTMPELLSEPLTIEGEFNTMPDNVKSE